MLPNAPVLTVNLSAIRANYRLLKSRHAKGSVAAVVKADAYGLGMKHVAPALWAEGCRTFFVATLNEGTALRKLLPDARIGVFGGLLAREEKKYLNARLTPVLNDPAQAQRWEKTAPEGAPAILHVDTGMTRLGFTQTELQRFTLQHAKFAEHSIAIVMSHLACASEPDHPKNAEQLMRFREAFQLLPRARGSLANSSGLFLPEKFHFDMARPGCALYGINPTHGDNPMRQVATLSAPILQIRTLDRNETVGYGATYKAAKDGRIAIAGMGYADGWLRRDGGYAYIAGEKAPIAGRVSMDMIALDVSKVPEKKLSSTKRIEFINAAQTVDDIAAHWDTIGYEVFTRIGARVQRQYAA